MAQVMPAQVQVGDESSTQCVPGMALHWASSRQASVAARHASSTSKPQPLLYDEIPHSPLGQSAPVVQAAGAQLAHGWSVVATPAQTHTLPALHSASLAHG